MSHVNHNERVPRVCKSCIIRRGHRIKNGLEDGFCKNYTKLKLPKSWVIQKTKLNKMRCRKSWVAYLFILNSDIYKQLKNLVF
jgi:hypothetical protein